MLPTSNFVGGLRVKGTKQKIQKIQNWVKYGRYIGHVTHFLFMNPELSLDMLKIQTSNFAAVLMGCYTKNKKWAKGS